MMIRSLKYFTFLILTAVQGVFAQDQDGNSKNRLTDSIKNVYMTEAAIRNPLLRQISIYTDVIAPADIKSVYNGNKFLDGRVRQVRTSALINLPIKSWSKNSVSMSASVFQQHFAIDHILPYQESATSLEEKTTDKLTVGLSGAFIRIDSLFNKQVVYTFSVTGLTNRTSSLQKISYLGGLIFTLNQSINTRTTLGLLINVDPATTIPVIPVFGYWHKLRNDLELNVNVPQQIVMRKTFSPDLWATFGTSLSGSIAFFNNRRPGFPEDADYSSIELKTGPGLEYRITKKFVFGIEGGLFSPFQVRAFDRNRSISDYFLKNKMSSSGYLTFKISVLPFLK